MSESTGNEPIADRLLTVKGRAANGRFSVGNPGGSGNPFAGEVGKHRAAFYASIRSRDVRKAMQTIRRIMNDTDARASDQLAACRELLDRVIGKATSSDVVQRIERLETLLLEREGT